MFPLARRPAFIIGVVTCVLGTLLSLWLINKRTRAERENQAVALAAEYDTVEALAFGSAIPVPDAIRDLQKVGMRAVVLSEESIGELVANGQIDLETASTGTTRPDPDGPEPVVLTSMVIRDPRVLNRVKRGLETRFGIVVRTTDVRNERLALPAIPMNLIRSTSVGLNPQHAELARNAKLQIIARLGNPPGLRAAAIPASLEWAKELGATVFLPVGDQVLGRRRSLGVTIETLERLGMDYASPEFTKIGGDANIVAAAPKRVIRLHTAQAAEMDKLSDAEIVDRFEKAARERGMRILLLRPASNSAENPLADYQTTLGKIASNLRDRGLVIAPAHPWGDVNVPAWARLGQHALGWLTVLAFFCAAVRDRRAQVGALLLGAVGILLGITNLGQQIGALAVAVGYPIIGFWIADRLMPRFRSEWTAIFGLAAIASFVSLLGGIHIAGWMTGLEFLIKAEEFRGIKIAVFLPIVLVGLYFLATYADWRTALKNPITWGGAVLGIGLAGALGILLSRTGNEGVGVSGIELLFRSTLDNTLAVRPRTKEFLIGHPALIVALGAMWRWRGELSKRAGWLALLMAVAAVGQTGIVNTLCHGHIPVMLSVTRILLGLVIGCILGAGVWLAVRRFWPVTRVLPEGTA